MKKSVVILLLFILTGVLYNGIIFAQEDSQNLQDSETQTQNIEAEKVDKAYACLENKIQGGRCATLSPEEKIFVLMAIGGCKDEVIADSVSNEYWTSANPSIKMTSQAILALSKATTFNTKPAEEWLLKQQGSPEDIDWYLEIESDSETECTIAYDGATYPVTLKEDKTLNQGAGNCLSLSQNNYWLKINPGCFDREFEISCDEDFLTALIFKRETSNVIHVSDVTNSASANGRTYEKVNSACFLQGGECDYEGTLWAAMVLNYKGYDTSAYIPYLTTLAEENSQYLPESFLYLITQSSDYRTDLLSKQRNNKYWDAWKNKFYDTAVALYSISDEPVEKTNAKNWLLEVQGEDGCWEGNVRNTAFILASIWPRQVDVTKSSCEPTYYCMSEASCVGSILEEYDCPGVLKCCSEPKPILTCLEQEGEICSPDESCVGGTVVESSDTAAGEVCCVGGSCEVKKAESECEAYGGVCRPFECLENEEETDYLCEFGDLCCVAKKEKPKSNLGIIIFLMFLILLTVLGIIFRKKLRPFFEKLINKFKSKPGEGQVTGRFPRRPGTPPAPPFVRRRPVSLTPRASGAKPGIFPKGQKGSANIDAIEEVDEVLEKLKDMVKK